MDVLELLETRQHARQLGDRGDLQGDLHGGRVVGMDLHVGGDDVDLVFSHHGGDLVEQGLLLKTDEPRVGFVPAAETADVKLSDIADAVAAADFTLFPYL